MVKERGGPRYRSILFAPPQRMEWLLGATSIGADAVMHDLEDMVPIADKPAARTAVGDALEGMQHEPIGRFVRINGWSTGLLLGDLLAIVRPGLDVVALPKAETADDVKALDRLLTELEMSRGLPAGRIEIIPLAETASGLFFAHDLITASARVKRFHGVVNATREGDAGRSMRIAVNRDGREWIPVGVHVLMAARAAGISNIIGGTSMEPGNLEAATALAELSRTYGANSAICMSPEFVPIVNDAFTPTQAEVDHARKILVALEGALARGESSTVVDGELATYSHARAAFDTIEFARSGGLDVGNVPDIDVLAYDQR